jgi:hypothetical protein
MTSIQPELWVDRASRALTCYAAAFEATVLRQYEVEDIGGHRWTFSQTIAEVASEQWGGTAKHIT